jgi:hypothetical protein
MSHWDRCYSPINAKINLLLPGLILPHMECLMGWSSHLHCKSIVRLTVVFNGSTEVSSTGSLYHNSDDDTHIQGDHSNELTAVAESSSLAALHIDELSEMWPVTIVNNPDDPVVGGFVLAKTPCTSVYIISSTFSYIE